jgi:DNA-binding transcriptional ArsR family regulator
VTPSPLDRTLRALADPTRRRVVDVLRRGPQRAGELAVALDMTPPAMSRHLRVLKRTGLVDEDELPDDARVRVYRLRGEPFTRLGRWIEDIESLWTDQLASFKEHAERTRRKRGS